MTDLQKMAQSIVDVGTTWGRARGHGKAAGIAAFVELVAEGGLLMFVEDGEVFWKLPDGSRVMH
jgi:hypothetical protein